MTDCNKSLGLTAADHIRVLNSHAGTRIFKYPLVNSTRVSPELKVKYAGQGGSYTKADANVIQPLGIKVIRGDYLEEV